MELRTVYKRRKGGLGIPLFFYVSFGYKGRDLPQMKGLYMFDTLFDLQLFGEEGEFGSTDFGGESGSATDFGESQPTTDTEVTDSPERASFDDLIKGEYKEDYQKHLEKTLKRRMRGADRNKARLESVSPMLTMLAEQYGISVNDANNMSDEEFQAIVDGFLNDKSRYEQEAYDKGMDVDTLMEMKADKRELDRLREFQRSTVANNENMQRIQKLNEEAFRLQQIYPGFDLDAEMENPEFERLAWNAGVPLQTAYEVIHHDELLPHAMKYSAERAAQQVANSVRSGMSRPIEGGNMSRSASLTADASPRNWTKEKREDILRRVRNGERVVL